MLYASRGWTYQEYIHSSRKLFFREKELHWQCSCSIWHEETIFGEEVDMFADNPMSDIPNGFPDLLEMSKMVSTYNEKQFRYNQDALPAMSGLLSVASRTFTGGFLYGLPEMLFDYALGWRYNILEMGELRRRKHSQKQNASQLHPSRLPSWSWIGWQGSVNVWADETVRIMPDWNRIQETFPITEWYTADTPNATVSERRLIRSTWFTNRERYKDPNTPLPPGWTRHEESTKREKVFLSLEGYRGPIFKHEAMPEAEWCYPFPAPDISESTPPAMPEQTAYLFCETRRAYLRAWRTRKPLTSTEKEIVELWDAENGKVGVLHYQNPRQAGHFPYYGEVPLGKRVELVAISEYKACEATWYEENEEYGLPIRSGEYIAVLWVEWKDGVAYRLACGEVEKEAWDKLASERISLVLG